MRIRSLIKSTALVGLVGIVAVSITACGGSSDSAESNPPVSFVAAGPHPVGVTTLTLDRGPEVEVWYPAPEGTTGTDTYDVRDFVPELIRNILTGDAPATFTSDASRDADVDTESGPHPVVLFSHGFSGMRLQSTFLTAHLASWGMIVISPDHWTRDLFANLGGRPDIDTEDRQAPVDDLFDALDAVQADPRFADALDVERLAAVGHSAGGGTVLMAASDPRIDGYVSMASGRFDASEAEMPNKPSFFMAGLIDAVVPPEERTRPAYEAAPSPSELWIIDQVGHNGFDDFCTFGNGTGIIGIAEASGLGALLDAQPGLRALGEDGCVPPAASTDVTFPIVRQGVTAWLRHLFGIDKTFAGLGASNDFMLSVETASK